MNREKPLSHTVAMRGSRAGRVQNPTLLFLSTLAMKNSNLLNSHSNFNENRHRTPPPSSCKHFGPPPPWKILNPRMCEVTHFCVEMYKSSEKNPDVLQLVKLEFLDTSSFRSELEI